MTPAEARLLDALTEWLSRRGLFGHQDDLLHLIRENGGFTIVEDTYRRALVCISEGYFKCRSADECSDLAEHVLEGNIEYLEGVEAAEEAIRRSS